MDKYICKEIGQPTADGFIPCKVWVIQPPSALDELALTKSEAKEVGGSIFGFLLLLIVGSVMLKSINEV